jgi:hypothetical protein
MKREWRVMTTETHEVSCVYTVRAETQKEAEAMVEDGPENPEETTIEKVVTVEVTDSELGELGEPEDLEGMDGCVCGSAPGDVHGHCRYCGTRR